MSTSHGPWKFETRNCTRANEEPATRIAGHTLIIPRRPAQAQISQKGMITEERQLATNHCAQLVEIEARDALQCDDRRPQCAHATGAVLAMSDKPDAASGVKPRPIRSAPCNRHGGAKTRRALEEGAKTNATSSSCNRVSRHRCNAVA